jgi:hypothetical protein
MSKANHIKREEKMFPPALLFCFTVLVAERSPLVAPDLLQFVSGIRFKNAPLGDATLLPF